MLLLLMYRWRMRRHLMINRIEERNDENNDDAIIAFILGKMENFVYSRNRKIFYKTLSLEERRRRGRKIPRESLEHPSRSAWRKLYESGNDAALITLTGLDHVTFDELNIKFKLLFDSHTPHTVNGTIEILAHCAGSRGRPRLIQSHDCLGLCLAWTRTRGSCYVLQLIFGMTGTALSLYIRFGRRLLITVLHHDVNAAVKLPSAEKIAAMKQAVAERHPQLVDVWCTMDGLKLYLEQSPWTVIQNMFYNGWTHDHYVGNVIVFCPDGTIPIACTNVPGCVHDSMIAEWGNIYDKLGEVFNSCGGKCIVDSAFCKLKYDYLIKSAQSAPENTEEFVVNEQATAMRQSAEWGMRALQASFPRIKDRFMYEKRGERKLILKMIVLLYNYRANKVGINQIRNTYMPALSQCGNVFVPDA